MLPLSHEDAGALIHLDGLVKRPTITAITGKRRQTFVEDGNVLL